MARLWIWLRVECRALWWRARGVRSELIPLLREVWRTYYLLGARGYR